ncbi:hypothetical protein, partial [Enterobacter hormaechei]
MFAGKKSAQIREILISESAWEEMTCLFAPSLGELGFVTLNKAPESFDLLDGIKQPNNVVKGILEQLYKVAQEETRPA